MININFNHVHDNIRKLRRHDYISQEYMAAKLGIGQNAYSKLELGKTKLTLHRLFQISDLFGVEVCELLLEHPVRMNI